MLVTVFIFFSMNGIIAAASTAAALDTVPAFAGSASALIGSLQYGSGIISSLLLAAFRDGTPRTMAWIMALFAIASAAMARGSAQRNKGDAGWWLTPYPAYRVCRPDKHRGMAGLKPDFINLINTQRIHIENAT